jgi:antitoxin ParD1/3/4
MTTTIGIRLTEEDERIVEAAKRPNEETTDVIRRALRLLDREMWFDRARPDAQRLADEDLSEERNAW